MASFLKRSTARNKEIKERFRRGEVVTLIHSSHTSASLVEKLGEFGFDSVLIDCEHGSAGPREVEEMARAANLANMVSIVRPEESLPWLVTRYIECGADGVMLPLIPNATVAQSLVDRLRFSAPFDHEDRFVILMIETIEAVNNLPEIMKVEGVDAYLVAPGDLALTIGSVPITYEWQKGKRPKEVDVVVDRAIRTIVDAGKVCGTLVNRGDVQSYIEKGVRLVYDHANHMMARGARDFLGHIKDVMV
ncbi:HpcH/HpaI aldolase family protein [Dongia sedimenti]|uniref:Aldolase/citrate lyase family protein n=1 Tax=Dongia sedimenti TaxID=3064282 RepID=A0ABU0YTL3_9PROT|nr:aldolase/citrate lyase family protein [Rhodospirillaceae bacterium R-7]